MKRRHFLLAAALGIGGALCLRFALSKGESAIVKTLYKKLDYLMLDGAGVRQFAHDLAAHRVISSSRLHIIDAAGPLYTHFAMPQNSKLGNLIRHGEDRVVTLYLMSSDFFKNGADESRVVQYLGYYDPLVACNNPFARPATS
jgi:hypothetical protein